MQKRILVNLFFTFVKCKIYFYSLRGIAFRTPEFTIPDQSGINVI